MKYECTIYISNFMLFLVLKKQTISSKYSILAINTSFPEKQERMNFSIRV